MAMKIDLYVEDYASDSLEIYSQYVLHSIFTFDVVPPSLDAFHRKLMASHVCLVGVEDDKVIGFAYASTHRVKAAYDTVCETTIYMSTASQGAGNGTRLYGTLMELLQTMGYYTALGGITIPNLPSEKLHVKLGFEKGLRYVNIGYKDGAWRDVEWWRKDLQAFDEAPNTPLSLEDLRREEVDAILSK